VEIRENPWKSAVPNACVPFALASGPWKSIVAETAAPTKNVSISAFADFCFHFSAFHLPTQGDRMR
jgi:hypothetical protein